MDDNIDELRPAFEARLAELKLEHRDLDLAIHRLAAGPLIDELALKRLKKRKLFLRDRLAFLDDTLTPDIIA